MPKGKAGKISSFGIGDKVMVNKGAGLECLVVDFKDGNRVVVAWPGGETTLPHFCLTKIQ